MQSGTRPATGRSLYPWAPSSAPHSTMPGTGALGPSVGPAMGPSLSFPQSESSRCEARGVTTPGHGALSCIVVAGFFLKRRLPSPEQGEGSGLPLEG